MTPEEYLEKVLSQQKMKDSDQEVQDLIKRRDEIRDTLQSRLSRYSPSIKWAGSRAKGTMIRESYDGDMTCYFDRDENGVGETLADVHATVKEVLEDDYVVDVKTSALRIYDKEDRDLHIDVIPGRYVDASRSDVFLHQTTGDKQRLKTNLDKHIEHIKGSGVTDAICLMKYWKERNNIQAAKTFVLELLVVKTLEGYKNLSLAEQLVQVWTTFRDESDSLSVEDPANSNNDLSEILSSCRDYLSSVASDTLSYVENGSWEKVFGDIEEEESEGEFENRLLIATKSVKVPTKPWSW